MSRRPTAFDLLNEYSEMLATEKLRVAELELQFAEERQKWKELVGDPYQKASDAIGLFLEFRDRHGQEESMALVSAANEMREGEDEHRRQLGLERMARA